MKKIMLIVFFFTFALWVAMPLIDNGPPVAMETTINDMMVFTAPLPPSLPTIALAVYHAYAVVDTREITLRTGMFALRDRDRRCDTNKHKLVTVNSGRRPIPAIIYKT